MDRVGAVILAAGLSRRMGPRNKLLLPIAGKPMIRHVVETYFAAIDGEICVVTGYQAERIRAALTGLPVRFVHNAHYEKGQPFSVRAGLSIDSEDHHFLIGLGDQPQLTADDLRYLIRAHLAADPAKISVPYMGKLRGNPVLVPAELVPQLLADKANPGCGKFTRTYPEMAQNIPVSNAGFFNDIDTPAAFESLQNALSQGAET